MQKENINPLSFSQFSYGSLKNNLLEADLFKLLVTISDLRLEWNKSNIKKSGLNTFHKYTYFELEDIVPFTLEHFPKHTVVDLFTFSEEKAKLTLIDVSTLAFLEFSMPIERLKENTSMQTLGAIQTYCRRYLYLALLNIVEADALDQQDNTKIKKEPEINKEAGNLLTATAKLRSLYTKAKKENIDENLLKDIENKMKENPPIETIYDLTAKLSFALEKRDK